MKTCFKCGVEKAINEFYKHPMMADGHLNKCKECAKRDVQENYAKRRAQYSAYDQMRHQRPERRKKMQEYHERRKKRNPLKARAWAMVARHVRDGLLERAPCEVCGNPKSQAHHEDYSKPLDVRWLCFRHHREAHGQTVTVNL